MPVETKQAIEWALTQTYYDGVEDVRVTKDNAHMLVDKVREYFNDHDINYGAFSYSDLEPYF